MSSRISTDDTGGGVSDVEETIKSTYQPLSMSVQDFFFHNATRLRNNYFFSLIRSEEFAKQWRHWSRHSFWWLFAAFLRRKLHLRTSRILESSWVQWKQKLMTIDRSCFDRLQGYLEQFGYLTPRSPYFAQSRTKDSLAKAISTFQSFMGINVTGKWISPTKPI